ncbi:MAG: hypothetical protein GC154_08440 [bacterium]|nr:hypothetical protein [bacterium]
MPNLRDVYAQKALSQVPRLLSSQDRNQFSPTYGCMNREYWLCRSTDFPNSIAQFGVHALALAYAHDMPGNPYRRHPKVLQWTLAGMDYWTRIQHRDGSFDEFYPNERGWAGPTGFLVYVMCDSYRRIKDEVPADLKERLLKSIHRAALFLAGTDESGVLANHHAMALLPMYEAYTLVHDEAIRRSFIVKLDEFFSYCHEEGWCLEYDGADPGYLSATISFMAKLRRHYEDDRFMPHFKRWVEFSSYFVYPNGHYAGTAGSRQTLHFYPHGYELLANEIPLAARVADRMLEGLRDGALVPPEIQGERYFVYRMPELMLSYIDYGERPAELPPLPYEREGESRYFEGAKVWAGKRGPAYTLVNAAKGGVVKHFDVNCGKLRVNNCGLIGKIREGAVFTSQWIDPKHEIEHDENRIVIRGRCHKAPSKVFNPFTFIIFRVGMLLVGWHAWPAYHLKGLIRKILMLGAKPTPIRFERDIVIDERSLSVMTTVILENGVQLEGLSIGDEFPARYVPQSRYFQPQELDVRGRDLSPAEVEALNRRGRAMFTEYFDFGAEASRFSDDLNERA